MSPVKTAEPSPEKRLPKGAVALILLACALLGAGGYLLIGGSQYPLSFPLDDAWIHQTYARNLATTGQLAYRPGEPSAGSTSPAWSFLLSVGYLLGVDYRAWAYAMGALSLAAGAWFAYRLAARLPLARPWPAFLTGLLCAIEFHLVWASISGMETMLFTALSLALLDYYAGQLAERTSAAGPVTLQVEQTMVGAVGIGLMGGVLTLARPEGIVLAGLVIAAMFLFPLSTLRGALKMRLVAAGVSLLSLGLVLTPYVAFNLRVSGSFWPNTYYAKQTEYAIALDLPLPFWRILKPTLVGAQALLMPGFLYAAYRLIRERRWSALVPMAWWLIFLTGYALRLPMGYQHGRYSIPSIPLLFLYGLWGTSRLIRPNSPQLLIRVISRAVIPAVALGTLGFWIVGANTYVQDVGYIEGELVATAHWLNENTEPGDLIAVHDIGAVGYLSDRPLLDMAGLISPKVIPFMTDADKLAEWIVEQGARYAVFFPDFGPTYVQLDAHPQLEKIRCTDYAWTRTKGRKNLCVYRVIARSDP